MVGFVIVSHSGNLAKSVVELTAIMAPSARIAAAGGMDDGGFGTSFEKIQAAIESVYSDDGVLVLMDMGSAVMTTERLRLSVRIRFCSLKLRFMTAARDLKKKLCLTYLNGFTAEKAQTGRDMGSGWLSAG